MFDKYTTQCIRRECRTKAHRTKPHTLIFKKEDKSPHIYFIRRTKAHTQILQGGQKPTHQIIEKRTKHHTTCIKNIP